MNKLNSLSGLQFGAVTTVAVIVLIGAAKQFGIIDADFASTALTTLLAGGGGIAVGRASVRPSV